MRSAPYSKTILFTAWVSGCALLALSAPAWSADFDTGSEQWQGYSDFALLTEAQGIELKEVDVLDWSAVRADDAVIVIYPSQELDVGSFSSFVIDGGRVLVADDFGQSRSFLERLSVERREPHARDLPHRTFVDDHRGWPRFEVRGQHPLLGGVDEIVANYPAVLDNVGGAVISYDDGGGLVYDMMLGDGRVVLIADPGLFINAMMGAGDNRQLAANTLDYLCGGRQECRAWLVIEDFETVGTYADDADDAQGLAEQIESLNERLREVFEELPGTELLYLFGIFLVMGTVAYLVMVFPWNRARRLSEYIERHRRELSPPMTEFDWNVERFSDPDGRINYVLPAAILKESFEELFLDQFDLWPSGPEERPSVGVLAQRFDERYLRGESPRVRKKRRKEVAELLSDLMAIPKRDRVFLESDEYYSARDLERLYERIQRVLDWMGLKESYERRTRKLDTQTRGSRR